MLKNVEPPRQSVITPYLIRNKSLGAPTFVRWVYWILRNKLPMKFKSNMKVFFQENAFENVISKVTAIIWSNENIVYEYFKLELQQFVCFVDRVSQAMI